MTETVSTLKEAVLCLYGRVFFSNCIFSIATSCSVVPDVFRSDSAYTIPWQSRGAPFNCKFEIDDSFCFVLPNTYKKQPSLLCK